MSAAQNFVTEILLNSAEFFTENGLSTELGTSWGSGKFGEHVPANVHQRRRTLARKHPAQAYILEAFYGGFQGWTGEFLRIFCKHKIGTNFVAFSVEMSRRNMATESALFG